MASTNKQSVLLLSQEESIRSKNLLRNLMRLKSYLVTHLYLLRRLSRAKCSVLRSFACCCWFTRTARKVTLTTTRSPRFNSTCKFLRALPFFSRNFSRLIISWLVTRLLLILSTRKTKLSETKWSSTLRAWRKLALKKIVLSNLSRF